MIRSILFSLILILSASAIHAQSIRFTQAKTIQYHPEYALWDDWPDDWTTLEDGNRFTMYIEELVRGKVYHVTLYMNGRKLSDLKVRYDGVKSAKIRKDWNDPYVNCYYDDSGDYIYAQKVSFEQLSKDSEPWRSTTDSIIYFWALSENFGVALR